MEQNLDAQASTTTRQAWPLSELFVLALGLVGLLGDSLKLPQTRLLNVHLLFGVALLATIAWRLLNESQLSGHSGADGYYLYTRYLARRVYFLLYVLAAARLCLYLIAGVEARSNGGDFNYLAMRGSLDDFHVYIGYALAAVCLIRGSILVTRSNLLQRHSHSTHPR